ncbi:hypothetical protein F2Q70_00038741 [Brassica cretica]|uniref:Uncharacterized protein n=2 Tax=Brassica cretica TaxID=69181 RepID=A0A8S9KD40_BRACR|nr:hypothetical protein F2Q70_00038741 [Brassica cretica]KAF2620995.1 hypothetical protein F2Q68_00039407 [Brassica cretica]KAF3497111.1 hypothetical protein DY000_02052999 [Brassica cretica]
MASQTFSCRGHERSFSIFLLFVGVKSSIKIPHVRYNETHPNENRGYGTLNVTIYGDYFHS